jgi:transcription initiation factor TFIID subunit 11
MSDQYFYTRVWESIPNALPWSSGDPNAKGDPRKTVKWIDVCRVNKTREGGKKY